MRKPVRSTVANRKYFQGGGDRNTGAARMYDLMRRFEGGPAYG
jgi:hypothetical protein